MGRSVLAFCLGLCLLVCVPASAAESGRNAPPTRAGSAKVALVIGNAAYPGAPLKNPANDARDVAQAFRQLGFDVIERIDVTQKEMNRAITQFGSRLAADSVAVFYFAGHGIQVRGKNYLVPIDAQIDGETAVRTETVDVDAVLDQLNASTLNIVILDACRNNPFERRFRGVGGGLAQMDAPKGTLIAYATSPGKVASDGSGRNGLYTQELLKVIRMPGLEVEKAFKRVRANVARVTGDAQIPWESSSLTGDFFFGGSGVAEVPASRVRTDAEIEQEIWDGIRDSERAEVFQDYLAHYPNGRFAVLATARIRVLGTSRPDSPPSDTARTIQLKIGEQLDKVSLFPMMICDYSRPVSSVLDGILRRAAAERMPRVEWGLDSADTVLDIRPVAANLAKVPGADSDSVYAMRLVVEAALSSGGQVLMRKTYEERSAHKYASCCTCSAWDSDIDTELNKVSEGLVSRLVNDLAATRGR
ncbi:caspase family protein [Propionivibrio dicarboxylicus]|uniref:Caspase domain-containing protein n=1 Tax=Propionivibrio dicarboxylicus TaxID=83767 RepID=A0A1G7ZEK8_9RHOO|nr:caspase family protein [Propionivibrio dicarboxylicus]SDH07213.1 Caspase domain-containing protein [Propionivibrio dicarboxylicus]